MAEQEPDAGDAYEAEKTVCGFVVTVARRRLFFNLLKQRSTMLRSVYIITSTLCTLRFFRMGIMGSALRRSMFSRTLWES